MSSNVSAVTYREGDCRPIAAMTVPKSGGVQVYPIAVGDICIYGNVVVYNVTAQTSKTYYNCVLPANAVFSAGTGADYTITSITPAYSGASAVTSGQIITTAAQLYGCFAGIALHKTGLQSGEFVFKLTQSIDPGWTLVATAGRFEFPILASAITSAAPVYPGELIAGYVNGGVVYNQQVARGANDTSATPTAIGVACPGYNQFHATGAGGCQHNVSTLASLVVEIRTQLMHTQLTSGQ